MIDEKRQIDILKLYKRRKTPFMLTVSGVSMKPTLYQDDIVTIIPDDDCKIGDIAVFIYENQILIHRILRIKNDEYYCKGDNALRTEKVQTDDIIGKVTVVSRNDTEIPLTACTKSFYILSAAVDKIFFKKRFNPATTRATYTYSIYYKKIIKMEDFPVYIRNDKLDYIESNDGTLAVFEPESGDTHFIDAVGADILKILEQPREFDVLLGELTKIYSAALDEIKPDLEQFLKSASESGIVLVV